MNNAQNLTIGIDLDDTISNSSEIFTRYAILYNNKKNIDFPIKKNQLGLDKAFGWNDHNINEFQNTYLKKILTECTPKKSAKKVIDKLKTEGHQIIIITARCEKELGDPYSFTINWLNDNKIYYDKLIVNSQQKELACSQENVKIFIDDNFQNCINVHKTLHIPVFLFNSRFNTCTTSSEIERVYSWNEIYSKIQCYK